MSETISKNDEKILNLKKQIEEKKKALSASTRFVPVTNCSLELDGTRVNIQVLNKDQIITYLVKLNMYKLAAQNLELLDEFSISGFSIDQWMIDLKSRLVILDRKAEESKLRLMENRLLDLLSNEKKIELEIEEIAGSLGG